MPVFHSQTATIASSGTTSGAIDIGGYTFVGLQMPAAITGTTMTFEGATASDGTFVQITDGDGGGSALSITIAASKGVTLSGDYQARLAAWPFIKLVSGSSEGAERSITVLGQR